MGCATAKCKNPLVTTPFICCSFIIAIMCMATGGFIMSGDIRDKACFEKFKYKDGDTEREITGNELAKEYIQFIDKAMCSSKCPCPSSAKQAWEEAVKEDELKKYSRTWAAGTVSNAAKPFKNANEIVPMKFASSGTTYDSFTKCYDGALKNVKSADTSE